MMIKNNKIKNNYDEITRNPEEILEKWDYPGTEALENRIASYYANNQDSLEDIVNQIVLWKVNRQVFFDNDTNLLDDIISFECPNIDDGGEITGEWCNQATELIVRLLNCKGIRLPMASTILHFFKPHTFLIIDQRAYRVVFHKELEIKRNPEENADLYLEYLKKCVEYYMEKQFSFDFKDLDRYTYQLDIEMGNTVKY